MFVAGGFEEPKDPAETPVRRSRIPVAEFGAAISIGSKETMENDEVECLLANMIYKVGIIRFSCVQLFPLKGSPLIRSFTPPPFVSLDRSLGVCI